MNRQCLLLAEAVEKLGFGGGQDARCGRGRGFLFRLGPMAGRVWLVWFLRLRILPMV
jgi:hypothetical protein